jgi:hypothetical protein
MASHVVRKQIVVIDEDPGAKAAPDELRYNLRSEGAHTDGDDSKSRRKVPVQESRMVAV